MVQSSDMRGLRSGVLAKAAGVSPDTIRHYEKLGVLPRASRTEGGYRIYPANSVERVLVVQRALRLGFTLAELADVLKTRDAGGAPCQRVYHIAQQKLIAVESDIAALMSKRRYLKKLLSDWKAQIESAAPGERSHLLQSLSKTSAPSIASENRFRTKR